MKLIQAAARDFRSYSSIYWALPELGVTLIDGRNKDTGRSNMTGKTTLLDSIFWCLFGYLPKWGGPKGAQADAVIRRGKESCFVDVILSHNGRLIRVRRQRPIKLEIWVDGEKISGKTADLDSRLSDLIGMDADQFLISVYISQDRTKSFFTMGDAERAELLSAIAGLSKLDRALDEQKKRKSTIEQAITLSKGALQALDDQLREFPKQHEDASRRVAQTQSQLNEARANLRDYQAIYDQKVIEFTEALTSELSEIESAAAVELNKKVAEQIRLEAACAKLSSQTAVPEIDHELRKHVLDEEERIRQIEAFNREQDLNEISNQRIRERIRLELDLMDAALQGKCSHCKQNLPMGERQAASDRHLKAAQDLEKTFAKVEPRVPLEDHQKQLSLLRDTFAKAKAEAEAKPNQIKSEMGKTEALLAGLKREIEGARAQVKMQTTIVEQRMKSEKQTLLSRLSEFQMAVKNLEVILAEQTGFIKKLDEREAQIRGKIVSTKNAIQTNERDLDEVMDLIDLFGPKGFRTVIFEEPIERISVRAGQLFSLITDGIYSTRIDQVGETQKGESRLILRPVITKGGFEVSLDDLSGGARKMAMLSYDIAVSEAVGESSILFLDEGLDGLDALGKAEALRLLEEVARTRAVIVIDHTSETKSAIPNVVQVIYEDGQSRLEGPGTTLMHEDDRSASL